MRVTLVVGLPGSGKSAWADERKAELSRNGMRGAVLDDPRTPDELLGALARARAESVAELIITDPYLCEPDVFARARERLVREGFDVHAVFFENDVQACLANAARRPDKAVAHLIEQLARRYQVPAGVLPLAVWRAPRNA